MIDDTQHDPTALSPRERILRGLQAMAAALNAADAWTDEARAGYRAASATQYPQDGAPADAQAPEQTANISDAIAAHCAKFGDIGYHERSLDECVRQLVADYDAEHVRAEATEQQREMLSGTVRQDAALIADLMGQLEAAERARDEKTAIIAAVGAEKDVLRARAEAAEHRQHAAEHRAQRIVLDAELKARAEAAEATLATRTAALEHLQRVYQAGDSEEPCVFGKCHVCGDEVGWPVETLPDWPPVPICDVCVIAAALTGDPAGPSQPKPIMVDRDADLRREMRAYLDTRTITSDNIGDIRRSLFMPWDSLWNGWVRDDTAAREGKGVGGTVPSWTGATPPSDFKVSMTVPPAPATLPVYQGKEWQCRYVFPDQMCCIRPLGHEGDHAPAILAARGAVTEARPPQPMTPDEREVLHGIIADCHAFIDPEQHPELHARVYEVLAPCDGQCQPLEARAAAQAPQDGISLIAAERRRQMSGEGWTAEHDDAYHAGELRRAAVCYALHRCDPMWPWPDQWWKPGTAVGNLQKAGALIAAEIDRLLRLGQGEAASAPAPHRASSACTNQN